MVIFESFLSARAFKRGLEMPLLAEVARIGVVALSLYLTMRILDLADRNALGLLFVPRMETYMYLLEIGVGVIAPLALLSQRRVRESARGLFAGSLLIILGFVLDRMNVSITGMEAWTGAKYFPSWMEISVTLSIVTAGFIVFGLAAKYLPLFQHEHEPVQIPDNVWQEDLERISEEAYQ